MSGIVGIFQADGGPIEHQLLTRLTQSLAFRGPDGQRTWISGDIGFGHTLLRTTVEPHIEPEPCTLNGQATIVSDARLDARCELIGKLEGGFRQKLSNASDAELILCAYRFWGERCLDHLLGDFAFAIWDHQRRRLFCARDQLGIKPFFYARIGPCFIFSNTLECLRHHPSILAELDDLTIADFLLFDLPQDPAATSFKRIRRLPPAHYLVCTTDTFSINRYWSVPTQSPMRLRDKREYVERFQELLDAAVADRLRGSPAAILMSGGLDSPTVAASARRVGSQQGSSQNLAAYTQVFDRLIPDSERHYALLAADALHLPIHFLTTDDASLFERADVSEHLSPEPSHLAWPDYTPDQLQQIAKRCKVALTGFGADPALSCRITVYLRDLVKRGRIGRAFFDLARFVMTEGRFSRLYIRTRLRLLRSPEGHPPIYPDWISQDLEKQFRLRERWKALPGEASVNASFRPEAVGALLSPFWPMLFEMHDPGATRVPVEVRHPFFDLRLLAFLLSLEALPMCSDKQLLREAGRGTLPDSVRLRRKTPLLNDPLIALLQAPESAWVDQFEPIPELGRYVVRNRIPKVWRERNSWSAWVHLRPLSLNFWLRGTHIGTQNDDGGSEGERQPWAALSQAS